MVSPILFFFRSVTNTLVFSLLLLSTGAVVACCSNISTMQCYEQCFHKKIRKCFFSNFVIFFFFLNVVYNCTYCDNTILYSFINDL